MQTQSPFNSILRSNDNLQAYKSERETLTITVYASITAIQLLLRVYKKHFIF